MPVTAKLSRKFYETFGDELANELVEWLNQVDAAYRSDLRDLNELNFARFDAKLDARLADLRSELIKWMFLFWVGNVATTIGVAVAAISLVRRQWRGFPAAGDAPAPPPAAFSGHDAAAPPALAPPAPYLPPHPMADPLSPIPTT